MSQTMGMLLGFVIPFSCLAARKPHRGRSLAQDDVAWTCSGKGRYTSLLDWTCICDAGWTGSDCSVHAEPARNVSSACYNPVGDNGAAECSWYANCLSERYPGCEDHALEYAKSYGNTYCSAFAANRNRFSDTGQVWIDKVTLCLQERLVADVMRLEVEYADCEQIRKLAFDSHPECYVEPDESDKSIGICSILTSSPGDVVRILETTWDALFTLESIEQMLDVLKLCTLGLFSASSVSTDQPAWQGVVKAQLEQDGYHEVARMLS